jgi:hypothetical protein
MGAGAGRTGASGRALRRAPGTASCMAVSSFEEPKAAAAGAVPPAPSLPEPAPARPKPTAEIGGPKGPEPTRYGDWEVGGRCIDF